MYLQLDGKGATYEQLARAIQAAIRKGLIPAGGKLPPSRELACPAGLLQDVYRAKRYDDLGCGGIEQHALATFMHFGAFERHLRKVMLELRKRRAALIGALRRYCPEAQINDSRSGMHMVAWLPHFTYPQLDALLLATRRRSLGVRPIHAYYANRPTTPGLLLGVASLSATQLRVCARLLGEAVSEIRSR